MHPASKSAAALAAGLILLAACGGGSGSIEEKKVVATPGPIDEASLASIAGKVSFSGEKPASKPVSMDAVPACANQHKGELAPQDTIVGAGGALKNVFVYVKAGLPARQWPVPKTPVAMDQKGCMYTPRVLGIMVGQDFEVSNSDPTMHNVHPLPRNNKEWNTSQAPKGEKIVRQFDKEDVMIPFKCNVHPWMKAFVGVVAHPFFAVTGDDGTFSIKGLPPGEYMLEAWHERLGTQEIKVTLGPKETQEAAFAFKN